MTLGGRIRAERVLRVAGFVPLRLTRPALDTAHYMVTKHSRAVRLYRPLLLQPEFTHLECRSTESSVDDLGTCRGVVLSRAATILRSIETQPSTGRFVRSVGQSSAREVVATRHTHTCCVCWVALLLSFFLFNVQQFKGFMSPR